MIRVFKGADTVFTSNGDKIIKPIDAIIYKSTEEEYLELEAPLKYAEFLIQDNILVVDTPTGKRGYRIHNPEVSKTISIKALLIYQENTPVSADRGVVISYGKNLSECKAVENWDDVVTKIIPIGYEGARLPEGYLEVASPHQRIYERTIEFDLSGHLEAVVEGLKNDIERYTSEVANLNTSKINLESQITTIDATIVLLTGEISTINTRIAELGTSEPELKEKAILEVQVTELDEQIDLLNTEKADTEQALIDTEADIVTATSNLSSSQSSYTATIINDLRSQAQMYLNSNLYPHINYEIESHLKGITEVGDTVKVKHERMGIDMLAYVTAYEFNLLTNKYQKVEFGTLKPRLKSYISELESRIYSVTKGVDTVSTLIEQLNDQIVLKIDDNGRIGLFRLGRDRYGTEIFIKADNIKLEGLVTANKNFKILEDGSIEAIDGKFKGIIEALSGEIAGFEFTTDPITGGLYFNDGEKFFRISPNSAFTGEGGHDTRYATIDLGEIINGKPVTNIHWRSDGYGRVGHTSEDDFSIQFNAYKRYQDTNGEEGSETILWSKYFWIDLLGIPHIKNSPDIEKGVINIDAKKNENEQISTVELTFSDFTTTDLAITYNATGDITKIGDTTINYTEV